MTEVPPIVLSALADAQARGFIGAGPLEPHVDHALRFAEAVVKACGTIGPRDEVVDLGSGGGVPGLVLASVWPEATLRLVEGSATRAAWLKQYVGDCGWSDRVKVVGERAELAGRYVSLRGQAAAVVARAFGRSSETAECGAPFLRQGGALVVSEPPRPPVTPRWPAEGLAELGLRQDLELRLGGFAVFRQCDVCPGRYPRRVGVPRKRPLF